MHIPDTVVGCAANASNAQPACHIASYAKNALMAQKEPWVKFNFMKIRIASGLFSFSLSLAPPPRRRLTIPKGVRFISPVKNAGRKSAKQLVSDQQLCAPFMEDQEAVHRTFPGARKQERKKRLLVGEKKK